MIGTSMVRRTAIDRPEMQEQTFAVFQRRNGNLTAIPAGFIEARVLNAAAPGLWRERHGNRAVPRQIGQAQCGGVIQQEVPLAVQRDPVASLKLRPRYPWPRWSSSDEDRKGDSSGCIARLMQLRRQAFHH